MLKIGLNRTDDLRGVRSGSHSGEIGSQETSVAPAACSTKLARIGIPIFCVVGHDSDHTVEHLHTHGEFEAAR